MTQTGPIGKERKPKRRPQSQSLHKTKRFVRRSMDEHVQGTTVRPVEVGDLPTGCCHLMPGNLPCTRRMTTVAFRVEWRWVPEEQDREQVVKMFGYCKTHRPKRVDGVTIDLPEDLIRKANGPKSQKARIRKMEEAMYIRVVPEGGTQSHLVDRLKFNPPMRKNWTTDVPVLCGRRLKVGIAPTPKELAAFSVCGKCEAAKEVVHDEEV